MGTLNHNYKTTVQIGMVLLTASELFPESSVVPSFLVLLV